MASKPSKMWFGLLQPAADLLVSTIFILVRIAAAVYKRNDSCEVQVCESVRCLTFN